MKVSDFQIKAIIGHGHFGVVQVVKEKVTEKVYAMKVLQKSDIMSQPDTSCYQEERDIMAKTLSPWITQLHFAFQDSSRLFLVMEFLAGGDLLSLLSRHDDIFEEEMAKFYIAEMAIAINSLHDMGYLHRDIKPENILLDRTGHVKLADFGSAALMNIHKKVSARMPVGTPDYIAPELLTSLNEAHRQTTYGPEIDWWSLGVCAYEMLYGDTPFTNEHSSQVSTYANIMDHKNSLKFPSVNAASSKAKDLIRKLLTDAETRFGWKEIRKHPFFYKLQWDLLRQKEAAYVPTLNSLDDTSHFEEVERVEKQPNLNLLKAPADVQAQQKKFSSFDFVRESSLCQDADETIPKLAASASKLDCNNSNMSESHDWVEHDLDTAVCFGRNSSTGSLLEKSGGSLSLKLIEKDEEIERLTCLLQQQRQAFERDDDDQITMYLNLKKMQEEMQDLECGISAANIDELKSQVVTIETEKENLRSQLMDKNRHIEKLQAALEETQRQAQIQRQHYASAKRMSRDGQRKDLELMELRSETWQSLLEDKQDYIEELATKVQELEELVEAYQDSEEQQASHVSQMQHKLNTSLQEASSQAFSVADVRMSGGEGEARVELSDLHHSDCPSKKKLTLHVTLKAGRCSFVDNKTVNQLQDLQKSVDKYAEKAKEWRVREEELKARISILESDNSILKQKEGMSHKLKEKLMEKVTMYQQECGSAKSEIRNLQETMKTYLDKTATLSDTENTLKKVQSKNLALETELTASKEESQRMRQSALDKTNEMEDVVGKLQEQRVLAADYKKKYECRVEVTEAKVSSLEEQLAKVTSDRQRLERREETLTTQMDTLRGLVDDSSVEKEKLDRRITDLQSHLQQLQQKNSQLLVEVESLQKASAKNDEHKQSKAELTFQLNRAQQQNTELERRITQALRDKQACEDKVSLVEREKDRLGKRIERLEVSEKEKHQLEAKVEKMSCLERDNRRLEIKLERLNTVEKEKLNLEERIERFQLDLRREKVNVETLHSEKKTVEAKLQKLSTQQETDKNFELSELKMKLSLLQSIEKEKQKLEKDVEKLNLEIKSLKVDNDKQDVENKKLDRLKNSLQNDKERSESQLEALKAEKSVLDEQVAKLNKELDRLESGVGRLQQASLSHPETDTRKLTAEVNRLKRIVDRLESERPTKESGNPRTSGSGLIEKLQREKSELQKKVETLEKPASSSSSSRRVSGWRGVRLDSDDKTSKLETELADLRKKLAQVEEKNDKQTAVELDNLKSKNQSLEDNIKAATAELDENKKHAAELKSRLDVQTDNVSELRAQLEEQGKMETELIVQLEKEAKKASDLKAEKEALQQQVSQLQRKSGGNLSSSTRMSGENKFEKRQLESKIAELTEERDKLQEKLRAGNVSNTVNTSGGGESDAPMEALRKELQETKRELEIRKGAKEFGGDIPAYLRHELNESDLALSEARSLLQAQKRQEVELRDRLDKLQRIIDNKGVENARYLQNSQDAVAELKNMKLQKDTLARQCRALEERYATLQREKGCDSSQTVMMMEEMNNKNHHLEVEAKRVAKLTKVVEEQEAQLKDAEQALARAEQRQAEWEKIEQAYKASVSNKSVSAAAKQAASSEEVASVRQQLSSQQAVHQAEVERLTHSLREERARGHKLAGQLSEIEEKERASTNILESEAKEMERLEKEKRKLKEELTEMLSDNCKLRKENLNLSKHLEEAMAKFEMIIGEKVSLENFTEALQGLHFLDKYKFESQLGQQQKLIDYLQELYHDHAGKKKKKASKFFGGSKGKESKDTLNSLPLQWTDPQTALEQERSKLARVMEQCDKLREDNFQQSKELLTLRSFAKEMELEGYHPSSNDERRSFHQEQLRSSFRQGSNKDSEKPQQGRVQINTTVKLTQAAMEALSNPPNSSSRSSKSSNKSNNHKGSTYSGSTASLASNSSSSSYASSNSSSCHLPNAAYNTPGRGSRRGHGGAEARTPRNAWPAEAMSTPRMKHVIPHRFATGLNTRATKCALCLGSVNFVRQSSKCQECGMVVHPKCAQMVGASCGISTEYVRSFSEMMHKIYQDQSGMTSEIDQSAVKMEGWLKVPRVAKSGWENRYVVLEGTWLTMYMTDEDSSPVDSFDLNPMDAEVSVHSAVASTELNNTASTDVHYVMRLDQDPLTTCFPGRYVYLMATNYVDKQRWVASLEAVVKSAQCSSDLYRNRSQMLTVMSLKGDEQRDFNCTLVLSSQLVLAGTDDGLYAFNPSQMTSKKKQMTQISGFGGVHQMCLAKGVDLIVILTGPERRIILLENKLVKCRMSQTLGGETAPMSFRTIDGLKGCTIFDTGLWNNASYLCVGTTKKVYLMKYNPSLAMYCVRKEFPSTEPCSCVCIAESQAIVGTERFYKISLEHPSMLDFVDRQDETLAFAAYKGANHSSFPLSVVKVSPDDLPLEFLLCFHEFGVFVDQRGQRTRAQDVKWSGLPLAFAFVEPFLYVTYCNTIIATLVPTDKSQAKGRQTVIDVQSPRCLGSAPSPGCVYISSVNKTSAITEIVRVKGQDGYLQTNSPDKENMGSIASLPAERSDKQVTFASPAKSRVHRLRRQNSLSSLNSNSSSSTFASVESDV